MELTIKDIESILEPIGNDISALRIDMNLLKINLKSIDKRLSKIENTFILGGGSGI